MIVASKAMSRASVGRALLLAARTAAIAQSRWDGRQGSTVSSPIHLQFDAGIFRHSLDSEILGAKAHTTRLDISPVAQDSRVGMVWIPGGRYRQDYPWGNELKPQGQCKANTFQGHFPDRNTSEDGYTGVAPVASFEPTILVCTTCREMFGSGSRIGIARITMRDGRREVLRSIPRGRTASFDPLEPGVRKRVQKGGSFLCTDQYCARYMPGARGKGEFETGTNHVGFRCVRSQ
jgi:hypothetical protein